MTDVVQQRRQRHRAAVQLVHTLQPAPLLEDVQRALREMIDADRMIETRVRRARIDEVCVAQLLDVAQPLIRGGVDDAARDRVDPDRVPERIADRDRLHGCGCVTG